MYKQKRGTRLTRKPLVVLDDDDEIEETSFVHAYEAQEVEREQEGNWYVEHSMWDVILIYGKAGELTLSYAFATTLLIVSIVVQIYFVVIIGDPAFTGPPVSNLVD